MEDNAGLKNLHVMSLMFILARATKRKMLVRQTLALVSGRCLEFKGENLYGLTILLARRCR